MAAFFVVVAILVGHTVGYLLHAENGLVELSHPIPIFSHYGDMPQFREHDGCPPFSPLDSFQRWRHLSTVGQRPCKLDFYETRRLEEIIHFALDEP